MKRIVRLTESDIIRLVKKIVKEQTHRDESGDLQFEFSSTTVMLRNLKQKKVQSYLLRLPLTLKFLAIIDCEGADFSDVDLCLFTNLVHVNLKGTPNNMMEHVDCGAVEYNKDFYEFPPFRERENFFN